MSYYCTSLFFSVLSLIVDFKGTIGINSELN